MTISFIIFWIELLMSKKCTHAQLVTPMPNFIFWVDYQKLVNP